MNLKLYTAANRILYCILILFVVFPLSCTFYAYADTDEDLSEEPRSRGIVFLPGAFYTPETNWGLAAGLLYYFQLKGSFDLDKPSSISTNIIYTLENQKMLTILPVLNIKNSSYIVNARLKYIDYPEKFYGIGKDTTNKDEYISYTNRGFQVYSSISKRIIADFYAGININYQNTQITDIEDTDTEGYEFLSSLGKSEIFGLGINLKYDTRDNAFYTGRGMLINILIDQYQRGSLGDYSFQSYLADLRYFWPIDNDIFAIQLYGHFNSGDCPFYAIPTLGGPSLLRGIIQNRHRDINLIALQAEYRKPVSRKFILIFFAGTGNVAGKISEFEAKNLKYSAGTGIRYRISDSSVNLRFDIGFSSDRDINFYIGVLEAF